MANCQSCNKNVGCGCNLRVAITGQKVCVTCKAKIDAKKD